MRFRPQKEGKQQSYGSDGKPSYNYEVSGAERRSRLEECSQRRAGGGFPSTLEDSQGAVKTMTRSQEGDDPQQQKSQPNLELEA